MIEFIVGITVGVVLCVWVLYRYRNRDGKIADIVRRATGITKEQ